MRVRVNTCSTSAHRWAVARPGRELCRTSRRPSGRPRQGRARRAATLGARRLGAGRRGAETRSISSRSRRRRACQTRSDPVRAHAGVPVHLLPRRRLPDGGRSRRRAANGIARSALRRRAPLQLRDLRRAGSESSSSASTTSTRRFRGLRVGREAARRELRGRGPRARLPARRPPLDRDDSGARVPRSDGAFRGDAQHRRLVHTPRRRGNPANSSAQRCPASR